MCVFVCVSVHAHMYAHTIYTYIHVRTCEYVCVCVRVHVHVCVCTCLRVMEAMIIAVSFCEASGYGVFLFFLSLPVGWPRKPRLSPLQGQRHPGYTNHVFDPATFIITLGEIM